MQSFDLFIFLTIAMQLVLAEMWPKFYVKRQYRNYETSLHGNSLLQNGAHIALIFPY